MSSDSFNLVDFIKKQGADLAGLPSDMLNLIGTPFVNAARNIEAVSKSESIPEPKKEITKTGTSESNRKALGVSTEDSLLETILSLASPDPTKITKLGGLGAAGLGIIRRGGASDLNMWHSSRLSPLLDLLGNKNPHLTDPSIAISDKFNPFGGEHSVQLIMNPASPRFDPLTGTGQLINRDAFVDTSKHAADRPARRGADMKMTQDMALPLQHALSILLSPDFTSFQHYEDSVLGASRLRKFSEESATKSRGEASSALIDALNEMGQPGRLVMMGGYSKEGAEEVLNLIRKSASQGSVKAKTALARTALHPSEYAELKLREDLPLNKETLSGVILPDTASGFQRDIQDMLPGVPVGEVEDLLFGYRGTLSGISPDQYEKELASILTAGEFK